MVFFKILFLFFFAAFNCSSNASDTLLNVSYDPTRELFVEINEQFQETYKNKHDKQYRIKQSHGGSGKQTKAILYGLRADVVTLATPFDVDILAQNNFLNKEWREYFPNNSSPYRSVIVFLVRKGNPKGISNWGDLIKKDISVITPNPKTSGGAVWNYLAALGYAKKTYKDKDAINNYIVKLFKNVPILDTSARNATLSFTERKKGDVFITWENEALFVLENLYKEDYEIIYPVDTIQVDMPVALVEKNTKRNQTEEIAKNYINFIYSDLGQEIIGKHYFRPINKEIMNKFKYFDRNTSNLFTIDDVGNWDEIKQEHFSTDGVFDSIYASK